MSVEQMSQAEKNDGHKSCPIDYNRRVFKPVKNGGRSAETVFFYRQEGPVVYASYNGGDILHGTLVGIVNADGSLQFRYHHINQRFQLRSGTCTSTFQMLRDGRLRLYEKWNWLDEDRAEGESILEEVKHTSLSPYVSKAYV
ncbi:n-acetylglutamate synthase [Fictibacillus gelatini]|uniref:n-acetylglutamate synthase n=1 Tax=Fictibacillus gelatini TaxID=225985 RepID=UPI001FE0E446|nr:n-acetylglutamate synthase [Fictibacillus gelatini]